jgi:integral membrane protein
MLPRRCSGPIFLRSIYLCFPTRVTAENLERLLAQYRVMAFTTAVLLIVLVFVGVPLQVAAGRPGVVNVVGTIHGFLYIVYLVAAFRLTWRLRIPVWQMLLVLLAGTVPFAAFVAERKMTNRVHAALGHLPEGSRSARSVRPEVTRRRWLSKRALLLHTEVLIVAPACAVAGWWQATRALAGNGLSWVYSVEWPIFSLLAIWGWWHLVHEDPEAFKQRRLRRRNSGYDVDGVPEATALDPGSTRWARILAVLVGLEMVIGFTALGVVPFNRPSGLEPHKGQVVYALHATVGTLLAVGGLVLLLRLRSSGRVLQLSGWLGLVGLLTAGAGGLLTAVGSLVRFLGIVVMLAGGAVSVFAYMIPTLSSRSSRRIAGAPGVGVNPPVT